MSTILTRKGCARCGGYVFKLDEDRTELRIALNRYNRTPTETNRRKVEAAQSKVREAKRQHDGHRKECQG